MRYSDESISQQDEGIAWPSYVDFLCTFIFVLLIFIGSLLYLLSGDIRLQNFQIKFANTTAKLKDVGLKATLQGMRMTIPLSEVVYFDTFCPKPIPQANDGCGDGGIPKGSEDKLREVAKLIPARCLITLQGKTDRQPTTGDPFGNYKLSTRRAEAVLEFFTKCDNCGAEFKENILPKITLAGIGERGASPEQTNNPKDRTVDIIIDCSGSD